MQIVVYHIPTDSIWLVDEISEIVTDGEAEFHYKLFELTDEWIILGDF